MPGAEVDDLEPVRFLAVGDDREAVVAPDLVLGGLFRVLDLRLQIRPVVPVELPAERAIGDLARHPLPREPQLHLVAQIPPRLLEAPDERARIEPRRLPAVPGPLGKLRAQRPSPVHSASGSATTSVSLGVSGISAPSRGKGTTGMLAPRRNSSSTSLRIAGLTSVSSSSDARRSLTTFFIVG